MQGNLLREVFPTSNHVSNHLSERRLTSMRRNETLLHLANVLENCNLQDLKCECVFVHCSMCVNELADDAIGMVQRLLDKPKIRSCRIPLVIDFEKMTDQDYWLKSKLFCVDPVSLSEALKQKIMKLVNMLRALQIKILKVDVDYAEKVFKRMTARLDKSAHILEYELWRVRHPSPTMKELEWQQTQLTADLLIKGILSYAENPTGDEKAKVRLELVKNGLRDGQQLPDNFVAECAKLRRYSYWKGEHLFMIDYHGIYTYLFSHCFEKFTKQQRIALYEYDVQLRMIHEDMMALKPELKDFDMQTPQIQAQDEELCKFIHPAIGDEEGRLIHEEIKRLVKRNGVQTICEYLQQMAREKRILLPPNPSAAYAELVRLGMPTGEGYSEKHFRNHYVSK